MPIAPPIRSTMDLPDLADDNLWGEYRGGLAEDLEGDILPARVNRSRF